MELAVKTATEGQLVHNIKQKSATKRHMLKSKHPSQQWLPMVKQEWLMYKNPGMLITATFLQIAEKKIKISIFVRLPLQSL